MCGRHHRALMNGVDHHRVDLWTFTDTQYLLNEPQTASYRDWSRGDTLGLVAVHDSEIPMSLEPTFQRDGDLIIPGETARGPWSPETVGGGQLTSLLASGIENHLDEDLHPARITFDLFRAAPWAPLQLTTRVARNGRRIRVVDVSLKHEGVEVARASGLLIRRSEQPPGRIAQPVTNTMPAPEDFEPDLPLRSSVNPRAGESRSVRRTGGREPAIRWIRRSSPLLPDHQLTPLERVAATADAASPVSNRSDEGLYFVNPDSTLLIHRMPVGEWICVETIARGAANGVSMSTCMLHDTTGPIGSATVAGVATALNELIGKRASHAPGA